MPGVADELPASEPMQVPRTSVLPFGTNDMAPLTVDRELETDRDAGTPAATKKPTIATLVLQGAGIADAGDYTAGDDPARRTNGDHRHDDKSGGLA